MLAAALGSATRLSHGAYQFRVLSPLRHSDVKPFFSVIDMCLGFCVLPKLIDYYLAVDSQFIAVLIKRRCKLDEGRLRAQAGPLRQAFNECYNPPFTFRRQVQIQHGAATIPGNWKYAVGDLLILPRRVDLSHEGSVKEISFVRTK